MKVCFFSGNLCSAAINPDPRSVISGFFPDLTDISVVVNRRTPGFKGHRCFNQCLAISDKLCKRTFLLAEYIADSVGGNDPGSIGFLQGNCSGFCNFQNLFLFLKQRNLVKAHDSALSGQRLICFLHIGQLQIGLISGKLSQLRNRDAHFFMCRAGSLQDLALC